MLVRRGLVFRCMFLDEFGGLLFGDVVGGVP